MTERSARPAPGPVARVTTPIVVGVGAILLAAGCAGASDNPETVPAPPGAEQTSLNPRGPDAQKIQDLFTPFFWIGVVIGVLVIGAVIYAAIRFRARSEDERPRQVHGSTGLEVGWTIAPALILLVMGVPTVSLVFDLAAKPEGDIVEINVTGKQWWWQYEYPQDDGSSFFTANEMYIPVDTPVYLSMTSTDVLHSFWVPNLAGKKDLAPGRTHNLTIEASEPGLYLGQCAEYCGLSHANMRLRVHAVPQDEYDAWVASQFEGISESDQAFVDDPNGVVAAYGCTQCHSFDPEQDAGIGPNLAHFASRGTFAGSMYETTEEQLRAWVRDAPSQKPMQTGDQPGAAPNTPAEVPGMPPFPDMTDEEVDELVAFLLALG